MASPWSVPEPSVLVPELRTVLASLYEEVDVAVVENAVLNIAPFNLGLAAIGKVHICPKGTELSEALTLCQLPPSGTLLASTSEGELITDGGSGDLLHLKLQKGVGWRTAVQTVLKEAQMTKWAFAVLQAPVSNNGQAVSISTLLPTMDCSKDIEDATAQNVWLSPIVKDLTTPPSPPEAKKLKPKTASGDGTVSKTKIAAAKLAAGTSPDAKTKPPVSPGAAKTVSKTGLVKKKAPLSGEKPAVAAVNGVGEAAAVDENDAFASLTVKLNQKLANGKPSPPAINGNCEPALLNGTAKVNGLATKEKPTLVKTPGGARVQTPSAHTGSSTDSGHCSNEASVSSPPPPAATPSGEDLGRKQRKVSPIQVHVQEVCVRSRSSIEIPVGVLQMVLKRQFSFAELSEMRQVHPHWDEICGQLLNNGYLELLDRADRLLTTAQRRLPVDKRLEAPISTLTNLQIHVLNPVDALRPGIDEGVCCFPYGSILDKAFRIVDQVEKQITTGSDDVIEWKPLADLSRRAQLHYKKHLGALVEERLGDVVRLKAMARLQRLDSFMVDATVNKLEKAASMARDDIHWELEQLRQQNQGLKKDNRELRRDYLRLEGRVEALEAKLKTMARLLG